MLFRGSHSDVGTRLSRQFADQEDEAADSTRKRVARLPIRRQRNDLFVELAKKHARIDHFRRKSVEQLVSGN